MTRRTLLFVAVSLWSVLTIVASASAQNGVPLRASHHGNFLPEGTEVVVLSKEGGVQRDGRFQPEFLSPSHYPRRRGSRIQGRDRLGTDGHSSHEYGRTQETGLLFFIYALTPDSALYWSYSAQRDSLKFDVVNSGVMSVAPVATDEIRDDVLRSFFGQRVTVFMPGADQESAAGHLGDGHTDGDTEGEHSSSVEREAVIAETSDEDRSASPDEGAAVSEDADSALSAGVPAFVNRAGHETPLGVDGAPAPFLLYVMLLLVVAVAAVAAVLARNYRRELRQVRREMLMLKERAAADGSAAELRLRLEQAEDRSQQMEEEYEILEARYAALERVLHAQRV